MSFLRIKNTNVTRRQKSNLPTDNGLTKNRFEGENLMRREWPLGHTPAEAQSIAATGTKRGAK
ncbi:hypothetical protein J2W50_001988 [Herbaspirillum frisingense]|uniref:Transposase n=1 Tax=Herbaspirillum frisingense TaxID=92645 RepID=A0ABU1PCX9_9BURK|nr:hypothetical protein [Herbaspirillum frisingense]